MNRESQQIAIAEVCGWKKGTIQRYFGRPDKILPYGWTAPYGWFHSDSIFAKAYRNDRESGVLSPPDYLNDLNAMHEALEILVTDDQKRHFVDHLSNINNGGNGAIRFHGRWACASATAAQYAEAFLRTLNLWVE